MNTAKTWCVGRFVLALVAAGCTTGGEPGGGEGPGDTLDVEEGSEEGGLRATTTVDGEEVVIEAHTEVEEVVGEDGVPFDDEYLVAVISGSESPAYAEVRLGNLTDELTGTLSGWTFAGVLSKTGGVDGSRDWAGLAGSQVGTVLSEVALRAEATIAAGTHPAVERHLALVAEPGPLLQTLPALIGGVEAMCGDGECSVDETDELCPEDCGCAAEAACGGVAPFGCYCGEDCAANGDCCVDACMTCGAGCPACEEGIAPCDGSCADVSNVCDGTAQCESGVDEAHCASGACRAGQVACDDGVCLEFYQFCDGVSDCAGGEDELCTCAWCEGG